MNRKMIAWGGLSLIAGAISFVAVFSYLAMNFNYPDILDGSAQEVLPRLLKGGQVMRSVWALYAFLPLLLIPGAVGAYFACSSSRGRMTLALIGAVIGAFAMCLGLARWPSVHWALAQAYAVSDAQAMVSIGAVFTGLNTYLGNYIGEFLGEICLAAFFCLTGISCLKGANFPRWLGWGGILFSALFAIGAFRNVTDGVQIVADINNGLLPLWLITLGGSFIWYTWTADHDPS